MENIIHEVNLEMIRNKSFIRIDILIKLLTVLILSFATFFIVSWWS